jgi:hypothetical protein
MKLSPLAVGLRYRQLLSVEQSFFVIKTLTATRSGDHRRRDPRAFSAQFWPSFTGMNCLCLSRSAKTPCQNGSRSSTTSPISASSTSNKTVVSFP